MKADPAAAAILNLFCCGALGYYYIGMSKKAVWALIYSIIVFCILCFILLCCVGPAVNAICIIWQVTLDITCGVTIIALGVGGAVLVVVVIGILLLCLALVAACIYLPVCIITFLLWIPFVFTPCLGWVVVPAIPIFTSMLWLSFPAGVIFVVPFFAIIAAWLIVGIPFSIDIFLLLKKKNGEDVLPTDSGIEFLNILPGFKTPKAE